MRAGRLTRAELKSFLDEKVDRYNQPAFIVEDPISVPHLFTRKEDIEIAGFLTATIAWGNRKSILQSAMRMMEWMDHAPFDFVLNAYTSDLSSLKQKTVHRTFNGEDLAQFIQSLRHVYRQHGGMEDLFTKGFETNAADAITRFRSAFFEVKHLARTTKHVSDPQTGSAAKRIHMFLRWMVRNDFRGVDFGLWKGISPAQLSIPLDVHSGHIARQLGLLKRTQNDAKSVEELDMQLRKLDATDPVKYDFALFGLGVNNDF
jgi:uncharacterized protein (TIGR02757 family)